MQTEYKVALVLGLLACVILAGIQIFKAPDHSQQYQTLGTLALQTTYDEAVSRAGFQVDTGLKTTTQKGITGKSIFTNDVYGGVTSVTVNLIGEILIDWEESSLVGIRKWYMVKGYQYELQWRDLYQTTWMPLKNGGLNLCSVSGVDTAYHELSELKPETLANPPHYVRFPSSFTVNIENNYGSFQGIGIRAKLYLTLQDNSTICVGTEEALVVGEYLRLTVRTDPADCWVTVQSNVTSKQEEKTLGKMLSKNGVATFVLSTLKPGEDVLVTVEKEGYSTQKKDIEMNNHVVSYLRLTKSIQKDITYTVTVYTNQSFSYVYLDDVMKNSKMDGIVMFTGVLPGVHKLVVENNELWIPKEQIIIVENSDVSIYVDLEKIPKPINNKPRVDSIHEVNEIFEGYTGAYEFIISAYDADNDELKYIIDWGDGKGFQKSEESTIIHEFTEYKTYRIRAYAYDGELSSDWSDVYELKITPTIRAELFAPESGVPAKTYDFRAYPINRNLKYRFDWGDGTSTPWQSEPVAGKAYYIAGVYTITLSIDDGISEATKSIQFVVSTHGNKLPEPKITVGDSEIGRQNVARIEVTTDIAGNAFDIWGSVMDSRGTFLVVWKKLPKTATGNSYVSTVAFTCNVVGRVTIMTKAIPTSELTGFKSSDAVQKTVYCYLTKENTTAGEQPYGKNPWDTNLMTQPEIEKSVEALSGELYNPQYNTNKTPGFEIVSLVVAIAIAIIILRRRKKR